MEDNDEITDRYEYFNFVEGGCLKQVASRIEANVKILTFAFTKETKWICLARCREEKSRSSESSRWPEKPVHRRLRVTGSTGQRVIHYRLRLMRSASI